MVIHKRAMTLAGRDARVHAGVLRTAAIGLAALTLSAAFGPASPRAGQQPRTIDPAAWGSDHGGRPLPEYMTGEECLFCHRTKVGANWGQNRHHLNMRRVADDPQASNALKHAFWAPHARDVQLVMGHDRQWRFLKRGEQYGRVSILDGGWSPALSQIADGGRTPPEWNDLTFNQSCAGCHATAVDSKTTAVSTLSLDCFVCHGDVNRNHANDSTHMLFRSNQNTEARVVASICGQCHLRGGTSKSTGRPYPNQFVAGDNLFRDFEFDFSDASLAALNPADRHIAENIRDIVVRDQRAISCIDCHDVHQQSARKHHRVRPGDLCLNCHHPTGPKSKRPAYDVHSPVCRY